MNRAGFWYGSSTYPMLYYKEILVPPKIRVLPSGTLSQTLDLEILPQQVDGVVNKVHDQACGLHL